MFEKVRRAIAATLYIGAIVAAVVVAVRYAESRQREVVDPVGAEAVNRALRGGKPTEAPKGVRVTRSLPVPAMRDGITLSTGWSGKMAILNCAKVGAQTWPYRCPTNGVTVGGIGGAVSMTVTDSQADGPARLSHPDDPEGYCGVYFLVKLTAAAPGMSTDTKYFWVWAFDIWLPGAAVPLVPAYPIVDSEAECTYSVNVSGIKPACAVAESPPSTRQTMDFTDRDHTSTWVAAAGSTVTVTATAGGQTVTASGTFSGAGTSFSMGATWACSYSFDIWQFSEADTEYARHSAMQFNGISVDASKANLYNPGSGSAPDGDWPNWKRAAPASGSYARITGTSSSMAIKWVGTGSTAATWGGTVWAPYYGRLIPVSAMHEDATSPTFTPEWESVLIRWVSDGAGGYTSETDPFSAITTYYQQQKSWEFTWEWQTLSGTTGVTIVETTAARAASGDDISGTDPTENDRQCGILLHWLDDTSFSGDPRKGTLCTVSHDTSVSINDPPGVSRPSNWTGSGGLSPGGDNDVWTISAGATSPTAARSLRSRHWLRLNRLAGGTYVPGAEYNENWPIMTKANLAIGTTLDDPDWWSSGTGGVDAEDVWHWGEYSYARLTCNAPYAGTATLTVNYSTVAISDPCWISAGLRWAEFEYTRTQRTVTYTLTLAAGANDILIDLMNPSTGSMPEGEYRLHHVDSISILLPANTTGSDQTFTLTDLKLTLDPGEGARTEPATHQNVRMIRNAAWQSDWVGFCAIVDGHHALQLDQGQGGPWGYTRAEYGLQYLIHRVSTSEAAGQMDVLRPLSDLAGMLSWQEGWTATDGGTLTSGLNRDSDGDSLCGSLYWFDVRNAHEWATSGSQALSGAPCVGNIQMLAGIAQDWYFYSIPRGRVDGLLMAVGTAGRQRSQSSAVEVYSQPSGGGAWTLLETVSTDEHARYRSSPVREKGYVYRIGTSVAGQSVYTREYTTQRAAGTTTTTGQAVAMFAHPAGRVPWTAWIANGSIKIAETQTGYTTLRTAVTIDSSGDYDSVFATTDGNTIYVDARNTSTHALYRWYSTDHGTTWTGPTAIA